MRPLLGLVALRTKGRFVKWLRLVKQPKYFIGIAIVLVYYGGLLSGRMLSPSHRPSLLDVADPAAIESMRLLVAAGVALFLSLGFLWPTKQPLSFDEAEIQYLFTAPLSRRDLIRYALLKFQPGILIGSFVSVMLLGGSDPWMERLARWPVVWALFTAWFLWATASGLFKARSNELPAKAKWTRRALSWGVLAAFWIAVIASLGAAWHAARLPIDGPDAGAVIKGIGSALEAALPLRALLAPFEAPFRALWPLTPLDRVVGWAALAVLIAGFSELCARSPVAFEDEAIERARKISDVRSHGLGALRQRMSAKARQRVPFHLGAIGRPEAAIVWKNQLLVARRSVGRSVAWVAAGVVVVLAACVAVRVPLEATIMLSAMALPAMLFMTVSAGGAWRNDLRVDLLHLDQLRTWPLSGRALIAAEIVSPAISALPWIVGGLGVAAIAPTQALVERALGRDPRRAAEIAEAAASLGVSPILFIACALAALFILCCSLTLLACALQNTSVLLFPGWARLGPAKPQGAAVVGQQVLFGVGRLFAMAAGILPGSVLTAAYFLVKAAIGLRFASIDLVIAAVILAVPLVAETWLLVLWCARLWDRLDPSREILEPGSG